MEKILPRISKNPLLNKSAWVAVFVTIIAFLVSGLINPVQLSVAAIMSVAFITTLITVLVVAELVDFLSVGKVDRYLVQNVVGALIVSLFLSTVLGVVGITSFSGAVNLMSGVAVLVGSFLLFYVGTYIERKAL